ncbi:MAG TPA: class I SAM-dependent methyltransferase [Bacteroidales bacterium]|nr:class I SAM-dependent methyltransferase [Bacteroidales bacterium]
MMNVKNKRHWYDGWIYDRLLAPNQKESFNRIANLISEGASVLDIGCGTGRLTYRLAGKCRSLTGIDLSYINIATALTNLEDSFTDKIRFLHCSLDDFAFNNKDHFDFAIFSYVLHEVSIDERVHLLRNASKISDRIVVADHIPETKLFAGIIREILEFFAGRDHYLSYRSYINNGGIRKLAETAGLKMTREEIFRSHLHIAVLEK